MILTTKKKEGLRAPFDSPFLPEFELIFWDTFFVQEFLSKNTLQLPVLYTFQPSICCAFFTLLAYKGKVQKDTPENAEKALNYNPHSNPPFSWLSIFSKLQSQALQFGSIADQNHGICGGGCYD